MYCERLQRLSDGAIRACRARIADRVAPTAIERASFVFEVTLKAPHDAASPAGADDAGARLGDATAVGKSPRRPSAAAVMRLSQWAAGSARCVAQRLRRPRPRRAKNAELHVAAVCVDTC